MRENKLQLIKLFSPFKFFGLLRKLEQLTANLYLPCLMPILYKLLPDKGEIVTEGVLNRTRNRAQYTTGVLKHRKKNNLETTFSFCFQLIFNLCDSCSNLL